MARILLLGGTHFSCWAKNFEPNAWHVFETLSASMAQMFLRSTGKNSNHVSCCTLQPISKPFKVFKNLHSWIASKLARPTTIKRCHVSLSIWGCIETHAIFGRMNIHKSQLCWCWPRHYCFDLNSHILVVVLVIETNSNSQGIQVLWHCRISSMLSCFCSCVKIMQNLILIILIFKYLK